MASVNIYLNFSNQTEEAFLFYQSVFGGEFQDFTRFSDIPSQEGMPELNEIDKNLIMHVTLPLFENFKLMGTDAPESMGFSVHKGNNFYISLHPDTKEEADRIFSALSLEGVVETPLQDMFWGAYYGAFSDKFGVQWMINVEAK